MTGLTLRNRDLRRLELTVTIPRLFRFRIWLGVKIIVLGARVTGCTINVQRDAT